MQIAINYISRIKSLKKKTKLTYVGLTLYIFMVSFSRLRWLWAAKSIGRLIQRRHSANYAVNSMLAVVFSQLWDPKRECDALMRIVRSGESDVELLARAAESAAYADELDSLLEVRNAAISHGSPLLAYLDGLIAFMNMDANYPTYFQKSVQSFLESAGYKVKNAELTAMSEQSKKYIESGHKIPGFIRQAYNILEPSTLDKIFSNQDELPPHTYLPNFSERTCYEMKGHSDTVILVSCSHGYLTIFSEYFLKKFRRRNKNLVHFHVISDDVGLVRRQLNLLAKRYKNINFSVEPLARKSQTYITIARFLICQEIMNIYRSDVLITDIDANLDFDLPSLMRKIDTQSFDIGLCDPGNKLPWSKFAAGFSFFKYSNVTTSTYLSMLSKYLTTLYTNGGFFSMDQTGVFQVYEYMQMRDLTLKTVNLIEFINFKTIISMPNRLNRKKIKYKWGDGGPQ